MDRRDRMREFGPLLPVGAIDEKRLVYVLDEDTYVGCEGDEEAPKEIPFHWEVCGTCDGKGSHVNPSIDSNGITQDEWSEWDQEDRENYISGVYDVECHECKGRRVVPHLDAPKDSPTEKWLTDWYKSEANDRRERESEMRFGY